MGEYFLRNISINLFSDKTLNLDNTKTNFILQNKWNIFYFYFEWCFDWVES